MVFIVALFSRVFNFSYHSLRFPKQKKCRHHVTSLLRSSLCSLSFVVIYHCHLWRASFLTRSVIVSKKFMQQSCSTLLIALEVVECIRSSPAEYLVKSAHNYHNWRGKREKFSIHKFRQWNHNTGNNWINTRLNFCVWNPTEWRKQKKVSPPVENNCCALSESANKWAFIDLARLKRINFHPIGFTR